MSKHTLMFETKCGRKNCENKMYVYGQDRQGNLPTVYCSKRCEGEVAYERKFKKP
jgi:hypothetical protein